MNREERIEWCVNKLHEAEALLEEVGSNISDKNGCQYSWCEINNALECISNAINKTYLFDE